MSGNCPKGTQQTEKHIFVKIYQILVTTARIWASGPQSTPLPSQLREVGALPPLPFPEEEQASSILSPTPASCVHKLHSRPMWLQGSGVFCLPSWKLYPECDRPRILGHLSSLLGGGSKWERKAEKNKGRGL